MRPVGSVRSRQARLGFSLVELVIVLGLLVPVVVVATSLAVHAAQEARLAAERMIAEAALETAATVLEAEIAPLVPGDGLLALSSVRLRYRARRAAGRWCLADSAGLVVPVAGRWAASRVPVPGRDSVLLRLPDSLAASGVRLLRLGLAAALIPDACPGGGAGLRLPLAGVPASVPLGDLVETEEVVELGAYTSGGQLWIGLIHLGTAAAIEPVAGPFGGGGVTFTGLDSTGATTLVPAMVSAVRAELAPVGGAGSPRVLVIGLRG